MGREYFTCHHVMQKGPRKDQECGKRCVLKEGCRDHTMEGKLYNRYDAARHVMKKRALAKGKSLSEIKLPEKPPPRYYQKFAEYASAANELDRQLIIEYGKERQAELDRIKSMPALYKVYMENIMDITKKKKAIREIKKNNDNKSDESDVESDVESEESDDENTVEENQPSNSETDSENERL